jgi:hypothetical protein
MNRTTGGLVVTKNCAGGHGLQSRFVGLVMPAELFLFVNYLLAQSNSENPTGVNKQRIGSPTDLTITR